MITPRDIDNKRFEQTKTGYRPEEVDAFLKEVSDTMKALLAEKEETDNKMAFLIETVKKYKQDEEALKDAMISAHRQSKELMADAESKSAAIVAEAQQKAEQIIAEANVKSDELMGNISERVQKEKAALNTLRTEVADFRSNLLNMYREHLGLINNIPEFDDEDEEYEEEAVEEATAPVL